MRKIVLGITVGLVFGAGATWLVLRSHPMTAPAGAAAEPAKPEEKPKENPLHVPPAKRAAIGLTLAKPTAVTLAPEVGAYGRVLDATPLIALVAELQTARAALAASEKELARAKQLFAADNNASAQSVEADEAAAARDRAAVASARARLIAGWGRRLAEADLDTVLAALLKGRALARLDVLPGDTPAEALTTAKVGLLAGGALVDAEVLGPAPTADAQVQGASFLALLGAGAPPVGAALRATLPGVGSAEAALIVPRSAIVYHQGSAWIFVLGEEDTFERRLVTLGRAVGDGLAVLSGVDDGAQVAATGAQQLLSAELQAGGAGEGEG